MDMEARYAVAMKALARREGHVPMLPPATQAPREDSRVAAIARMQAAGMTTRQIAANLHITNGRVSQIMSRA